MKIAQHSVVSMDYTLKNAEGRVMDTSEGGEPLVYLHGVGALIPGLEKQLAGKAKGDILKAVVPPEEAYGLRDDKMVKLVRKDGFEGDQEIFLGMQVQLNTPEGQVIAKITKIDGNDVTLDMNHPLSDMILHFDLAIMDVRKATKDEIAHGHVHGAGGHHHH